MIDDFIFLVLQYLLVFTLLAIKIEKETKYFRNLFINLAKVIGDGFKVVYYAFQTLSVFHFVDGADDDIIIMRAKDLDDLYITMYDLRRSQLAWELTYYAIATFATCTLLLISIWKVSKFRREQEEKIWKMIEQNLAEELEKQLAELKKQLLLKLNPESEDASDVTKELLQNSKKHVATEVENTTKKGLQANLSCSTTSQINCFPNSPREQIINKGVGNIFSRDLSEISMPKVTRAAEPMIQEMRVKIKSTGSDCGCCGTASDESFVNQKKIDNDENILASMLSDECTEVTEETLDSSMQTTESPLATIKVDDSSPMTRNATEFDNTSTVDYHNILMNYSGQTLDNDSDTKSENKSFSSVKNDRIVNKTLNEYLCGGIPFMSPTRKISWAKHHGKFASEKKDALVQTKDAVKEKEKVGKSFGPNRGITQYQGPVKDWKKRDKVEIIRSDMDLSHTGTMSQPPSDPRTPLSYNSQYRCTVRPETTDNHRKKQRSQSGVN